MKKIKEDESVTLVHIFDDERQGICKSDIIPQEIADLSNALASRDIYHLVLENDRYGYHIVLIDDLDSVCYRDKEIPRWHYLVGEYDETQDKIIEHNDYVVDDSNVKVNILDFIIAWLRAGEDVKNGEGE